MCVESVCAQPSWHTTFRKNTFNSRQKKPKQPFKAPVKSRRLPTSSVCLHGAIEMTAKAACVLESRLSLGNNGEQAETNTPQQSHDLKLERPVQVFLSQSYNIHPLRFQSGKSSPTCWLSVAYDNSSSSTWRIGEPSTSASTWSHYWAAAPPLHTSRTTQSFAKSIIFKFTMNILKVRSLSSGNPAGGLTSEECPSVTDRKSLIVGVCHSINEDCLLCIFWANPLCFPDLVTCDYGCNMLTGETNAALRAKQPYRRCETLVKSALQRNGIKPLTPNRLMDAAIDHSELAETHVKWWIFHGLSIIQAD